VGPGEGEPDIGSASYCTRAPCFSRDASRAFHLSIMATPDTIAHILTSTLNPDSSVRIAAELSLSELLKSPRKPTSALCHFVLTGHPRRVGALACATRARAGCKVLSATDESLFFVMRAHRAVLDDVVLLCRCAFCGEHSAIIVLRKYVKEHWSPFFQQFRGDAPPPEVSFFPNLFLFGSRLLNGLRVGNIDERPDSAGCLPRVVRLGSQDQILMCALIRLMSFALHDSTSRNSSSRHMRCRRLPTVIGRTNIRTCSTTSSSSCCPAQPTPLMAPCRSSRSSSGPT
jgi:hypothetical protein